MSDPPVVQIAKAFHERYEALAPSHGWDTQERSRVAWEDLPEENRGLMVSVVSALLADGVIYDRPTSFMTRFQMTFIISFAIGRWSKEHNIDFEWRSRAFEEWVDDALNDAISMTEHKDRFEADARATLDALFETYGETGDGKETG